MDAIHLTRQDAANVWTATYAGPHAARIRALFGSATVPTPFTASAPATLVVTEIRRLNPAVSVTVRLANS